MKQYRNSARLFVAAALSLVCLYMAVGICAADVAQPVKTILNVAASDSASRFVPSPGSEKQVQAAASSDVSNPGVNFTILPGPAGYPGAVLKPESATTWDLSAYGHIAARVVNTGSKAMMIALRVDNNGDWHDNPWNTESAYVKPGEAATITVIFGYAYGHKPNYPLKANVISQIMLFADKANEPESFRLESLVAGGPAGETPPIDPASLRTVPKDGVMVGPDVTLVPDKQLSGSGAVATGVRNAVQVSFNAGAAPQWATIKAPLGKWDLRADTEVRVRVKNMGATPVTPHIQVMSGGNGTDVATPGTPIAPGATAVIVASFIPTIPWEGIANPGGYSSWNEQPGTGTKFTSDAVDSVKVSAVHDGAATLLIDYVVADSPTPAVPAWLGSRPPVAGDWVETFDDEFKGKTIDATRWNIYGHNYWDSKTHWTKDDLILNGKGVTLHFEKKRGPQNDDPNQMQDLTNPKTSETDYACGYLDTYGKWVQRYGYFEARIKLPTAPGLWPTFWMMPDRGADAGPQWKREDTANGGMEFDIMEHLDRWGDHRYNIAMHWDGYGKNHKATGSTCNYAEHDKDGYITVGLLWTPGSATYYCNGKEMLHWEDPRISTVQSHFIIEMTTGGWDNNAVDDKQLPADYTIDYVRAWQRKDLASPVDSPPSLSR